MATTVVVEVPSAAKVDGNTGSAAVKEFQETIVPEVLESSGYEQAKSSLSGLADPDVEVKAQGPSTERRQVLRVKFTPGQSLKGLSDAKIEEYVKEIAADVTANHEISGIDDADIDSLGGEKAANAAGCYCRWRRTC